MKIADNEMKKSINCKNEYTITISAYQIENMRVLDTAATVKVVEIDNAEIAKNVKQKLMEFYLNDEETWFLEGETKKVIPLFELDLQENYGTNVALVIPPISRLENRKYGVDALLRIMDRLTAEDGCEWDKVQTHESIRINLIEEAFEAVDAINNGDFEEMIEELGDVLLQSVFHCVIAKNSNEFDFSDVTTRLCHKLVTRHTHVFGQNKAVDATSALGFWESAKACEKQYVSLFDQLERIPKGFPALLRAQKIYKKLVKTGLTDDLKFEGSIGKRLFYLIKECVQAGKDAELLLRDYCNEILKKVESYEKDSHSFAQKDSSLSKENLQDNQPKNDYTEKVSTPTLSELL